MHDNDMDGSEEDNIIGALEAAEGNRQHCDARFPASKSSLYRDESFPPAYDGDKAAISWLRPQDYAAAPQYFSGGALALSSGALNDSWFVGAAGIVAAHPSALVENLFGSAPDDFLQYGVYTCRLYKDGQWNEVVTDTRLPCGPPSPDAVPMVGLKTAAAPAPVYARCRDANEVWLPLLEKAAAKLAGSYEALHSGSIAEGLVDLTGGSVSVQGLLGDGLGRVEEGSFMPVGEFWTALDTYVTEGSLVGCCLRDDSVPHGAPVDTPDGVRKNCAYSVLQLRQVTSELRFVRVRAPWAGGPEWRGAWGRASAEWDDFPEVLAEMIEDPDVDWDRERDDGSFWVTVQDFMTTFSEMYVCRLFDDSTHKQYCIKGQWAAKTAGGAPTVVASSSATAAATAKAAAAERALQAAAASKPTVAAEAKGGGGGGGGGSGSDAKTAAADAADAKHGGDDPAEAKGGGGGDFKGGDRPQSKGGDGDAKGGGGAKDEPKPLREVLAAKTPLAVSPTGDAAWFNNPQYRVVAAKTCEVHVSLMQEDRRTATRLRENFAVSFHVLKARKSGEHMRLWELDTDQIVADACPAATDAAAAATAVGTAAGGAGASAAAPGKKGAKGAKKGADKAAAAGSSGGAMAVAMREVSLPVVKLEAGVAYNIVPHAQSRGREASFCLRLFSPVDLHVTPVPETRSIYLPGGWDSTTQRDTTGGPLNVVDRRGLLRPNPKWCQNPQFVLRLPRGHKGSIDCKIVVRRQSAEGGSSSGGGGGGSSSKRGGSSSSSGRKKSAGGDGAVGVTVCKVAPPTADAPVRQQPPAEGPPGSPGGGGGGHPSNVRPKKDRGPKVNAFGEPIKPKASSLKRHARSAAAAAEAAAAETVDPVERRSAVSEGEWYKVSSYSNLSTQTATLTLKGLTSAFAANGLLMAPSLADLGANDKFVLEVHADGPLTLTEVDDRAARTLAGKWGGSHENGTLEAGGSHMNPGWKKNPCYHLKLNSPGRHALKVTLARPEPVWRAACAKDTIGCMMGFYISAGPVPTRDAVWTSPQGVPWTESAFVPLHSVSTPEGFALPSLPDGEVYTITPATFEPGKRGAFWLSVSTDAEFSLTRARRK